MSDPLAVARAQRQPAGASPGVARAAAAVVLIRPGPDGPEVLLTRRPATMAFAAGIHVFPGGSVDPDDAVEGHPLAAGLTGPDAAARLVGTMDPRTALAHFVAATRETLEETGIAVTAGELIPLSRWVTPATLARRFDVWFFAAAVPAGTQVGQGSEEVETAEWITPAAGLAAARAGTLSLLQPTLVILEQLVSVTDRAAVAAAFTPGEHLDPPTVGSARAGVAVVDQRWAGGIPGRRAPGWLVGEHDLVLVDPGDPTGVTSEVIDIAVAARGGRLVGIALTGLRPEEHAGVELYAAGGGLPVVAGPGAGPATPYPVTELAPGQAVPFGDVPMSAIAADRGNPGAIDYLLPGNRRLP